jgi:catechol 2,3-dioxygenase-like lactoylglutathione lyase family enzyme
VAPAFIEHVNYTVRDVDRSAKLFAELFDWRVRWSGPSLDNGFTVHVGDERFYLALYSRNGDHTSDEIFGKGRPLNHIAIAVEDLDAIEARVVAAGLIPFNHGDYAPGRRFYFLDFDGIEFEIVSYADRATG